MTQIYYIQLYETIELLTNWEGANRYALKNANGELIYFAVEESDWVARECSGTGRELEIYVLDNFGRVGFSTISNAKIFRK